MSVVRRARVVLLGNAVKRTLEFEAVYRESPDGRYRRNPSRRAALVRPVAFEGEMDVVGPDLGHIVGVGHVDLDASDAFAVMALRFRHDRFQVVRHGLASIDVGVHVQQNLHSSVPVLL